MSTTFLDKQFTREFREVQRRLKQADCDAGKIGYLTVAARINASYIEGLNALHTQF
jgi:hypothetical protein